MRFMMMLKTATGLTADAVSSERHLAEMERYNEELVKAGILLARGEPAGFWLVEVRSEDEVLEWARRCPGAVPGESAIEIRPCWEPGDAVAGTHSSQRERGRSATA